jgi:hypothetical protein
MIRCGASSARDGWNTDCGHPAVIPKFTIIPARAMVSDAKAGPPHRRVWLRFSRGICSFDHAKRRNGAFGSFSDLL